MLGAGVEVPPLRREGFPLNDIVVDPGCFLGLCASAIEAYNRETNGFLMGGEGRRGRRRRPVAVLRAAYPIQTEERKRSYVAHGNLKAFDRARQTVNNLWVGLDLMGGYHSHTGADGAASLSRLDVEYIEDELNHLARQGERKRDWLELVLAIRQRTYARPHDVAWSFRRYPRKLGATIAIRPLLGYDVTLAGFWVPVEPNGGGIVYAGRPSEARLAIPWADRI
jgi:proteasome lid subunit RPN8/RPN11